MERPVCRLGGPKGPIQIFGLRTVIHGELDRMGGLFEGGDFFPFNIEITLDLFFGEDVTLEQEVLVVPKRVKRFAQASGNGGDIDQFFWRQIIKILIHGITRIDLVFNAVKASHQHGRECKIGVRRGIGEAYFDAFSLGVGGMGNAA